MRASPVNDGNLPSFALSSTPLKLNTLLHSVRCRCCRPSVRSGIGNFPGRPAGHGAVFNLRLRRVTFSRHEDLPCGGITNQRAREERSQRSARSIIVGKDDKHYSVEIWFWKIRSVGRSLAWFVRSLNLPLRRPTTSIAPVRRSWSSAKGFSTRAGTRDVMQAEFAETER